MAVTPQAVTWQDLAELRKRGQRPTLPVCITDRWGMAVNLVGAGCLAIRHRPGEPMPVKWLHGLDVILAFANCEMAGKVKRLMDARDVRPKSLRAWCACAEALVPTAGPCDAGNEPWAA